MLPTRMVIHHFRAIRDCTVDLADYTVLVGQNGAGKSTVLQALLQFFDPVGVIDRDDVHRDCSDDVSITVTLSELNERERDQYADSLDGDGNLTVTKWCAPGQAPRYTVRGAKYPLFDELRAQYGEKASVFTALYKQFVAAHQDLELSVPRAAGDCKAELRRWEREHPEQLVEDDVPFEFEGATKASVVSTTRLLYVPAVHEASDEFEGGRSTMARLVNVLVLPSVDQKPELIALRERVQQEYRHVLLSEPTAELVRLSETLTASLAQFVPGAAVQLDWEDHAPQLPLPNVRSSVSEDGVQTGIGRQGHGLQRAMIMALLQTYDEHLRTSAPRQSEEVTHVCLMIEEPELFQHPPRARLFRRLLKNLAAQPRGDAHFRVLATTHSPNFVSLENIQDARVVRKTTAGDGLPTRSIANVSVASICSTYRQLTGEDLSEADVRRNLHVLDPLKEALFATAAVLTEGVSDVGVLTTACQRAGFDYEARGIIFASLGGKGLLGLAIVILRLLGIPHYVVFDGDTADNLAENQRLLRLVDAADIPLVGTLATGAFERHAVLQPDLERVLTREFGESAYKRAIAEAAKLFGMRANRVTKNPTAYAYVVETLFDRGLTSNTLNEIVQRFQLL